MKLWKSLVLVLVLGLSCSVRSQDGSADEDDSALAAAAAEVIADSDSASGAPSDSEIVGIIEKALGSTADAVGSSSSSSDASFNDISPAVGAAAPVATFGASRPGIPRLGSGYLLEQFRNFNLPGRIRGWTERIRNLRLRERARQFRAGLVVNPDSLAYRTGRRFTTTLQALAKRVQEWGERVRARQSPQGASVGFGAGANEIARR